MGTVDKDRERAAAARRQLPVREGAPAERVAKSQRSAPPRQSPWAAFAGAGGGGPAASAQQLPQQGTLPRVPPGAGCGTLPAAAGRIHRHEPAAAAELLRLFSARSARAATREEQQRAALPHAPTEEVGGAAGIDLLRRSGNERAASRQSALGSSLRFASSAAVAGGGRSGVFGATGEAAGIAGIRESTEGAPAADFRAADRNFAPPRGHAPTAFPSALSVGVAAAGGAHGVQHETAPPPPPSSVSDQQGGEVKRGRTSGQWQGGGAP